MLKRVLKETKNNTELQKNQISMIDLTFVVLFIVCAAFAFWKSAFGFSGDDEAFYLTIPHRLIMGDYLFEDEWQLSQMSGLLTIPFVWLYRVIFGSTEGIMLADRHLYIILHGAVAIFCYVRLRRYGWVGGIASLLYFLYTPFDIMALSYNTYALDLVMVTGLLLATSEKKVHFVLAGICMAGAVLCCPYLAGAYFVYAFGVFLHMLKRDANTNVFFSVHRFLWVTYGVGAAALSFMVYIGCTCGVGAVFENLPKMLEDPEHPQIGVLPKLVKSLESVIVCHPYFKMVMASYFVLLICMLFDCGRNKRWSLYLIASCIITLISYVMFYPESIRVYYSAIMFPFIFVGFTSYLLCERKPKPLFYGIFIGGLFYAMAVTLTSNNYFYVIFMACAVTNTASLIFLAQLLKEKHQQFNKTANGKKGKLKWLYICSMALSVLTVAVLGFMQIYVKANHIYRDDEITALTCQLSAGPAKGIFTTPEKCEVYEKSYDDLKYYRTVPSGNILILSKQPWLYLATDPLPYGTFSAWFSVDQPGLNRLESYYAMNPDKIPRYIYIPKMSQMDAASLATAAQEKGGYRVIENKISYKLEKESLQRRK